jgi:hypothetical protein
LFEHGRAAGGERGLADLADGLDGLVAGHAGGVGRGGGLVDGLVAAGVGALDLRADEVAQADRDASGQGGAGEGVGTDRQVQVALQTNNVNKK